MIVRQTRFRRLGEDGPSIELVGMQRLNRDSRERAAPQYSMVQGGGTAEVWQKRGVDVETFIFG